MQRIRVLLVGDETRVRLGLRMRLGLEPDIDVVGEAAGGAAALVVAAKTGAEVVVMDVRMAGMDGIEAARQLREELPGCTVVMLSMRDSPEARASAQAAGAAAFVARHQVDRELVEAIRDAAAKREHGAHE